MRALAGVLAHVDVERRELAVLIFQVEGVAAVGEHDAADPDLVEDGELDLGVGDHLDVAADQEGVQRGVGRLRGERPDDRPQRQRGEPADVVDAAREVALEDRHAARVAADDQIPFQLGAEHERAPERIEEARHPLVAVEGVLGERSRRDRRSRRRWCCTSRGWGTCDRCASRRTASPGSTR